MKGVLELLELQIEGLRSFSENQTINFKDRDKLIQIDGLNKDTGGSSGSGKSSIAIAIDYLFGISELAGTVLKPWDGSKTPKVYGKFKRGGVDIEITRSTKDGLSVRVGDETTSGSSKLAEEKLNEVIGIPRDILKRLIQKRQDDGSFFIKMGPKDKYEFLIKVLRLEDKNIDLKFAEDEVKNVSKELEETLKYIENEEKALNEYKDLRSSGIRPECSINQESIDILTSNIEKANIELEQLKSDKFSKIEKLAEPIRVVAKKDLAKLNGLLEEREVNRNDMLAARSAHQKKVDAANQAFNQTGNELFNINQIKEKSINIGAQIKLLNNEKDLLENESTCGTCKQKWTGSEAKDRVISLKTKIDKLITEVFELKKTIDTEPDLKEKSVKLASIIEIFKGIDPISEFTKRSDILNKDIAEEEGKLSNIDQTAENEFLKIESVYLKSVHSIENEFKDRIDECAQKIRDLENSKNVINSELSVFKATLLAFEENDLKLSKKIESKQKSLEEHYALRDNLSIKALTIKESIRCLKSYILNVFQDTLTTIGETATDILSNVPNVSTASIFFEGFKETSKGGVKNEINAILSKNGYPDIPVKAVCGGEKCAIGLAIDLAVIEVIETKSELGTDFFIMDEPFNGLDSICREDCLEIIKNIDSNKKIVVIDHCNEVKEMVSDIIMVTKEHDKSVIV